MHSPRGSRPLAEDPDEPDVEPEPARPTGGAAPLVVAPGAAPGVEFEYRTELLTADQVVDGTTLPERLAKESADGWDLVDVLQAKDRHVILLRKPKKPERGDRRVGFFTR
jgi:hypothetical protein